MLHYYLNGPIFLHVLRNSSNASRIRSFSIFCGQGQNHFRPTESGWRLTSLEHNPVVPIRRNCSIWRSRTNEDHHRPLSFASIDQTAGVVSAYPYCFTPVVGFASSTSSSSSLVPEELSQQVYEELADETLENLYSYFDEILEMSPCVNDGDVSFSSGVLTIKLGKHGTYVINKQTPNRQIWLSSPTSGPKRYDWINKTWIYKHDGASLYHLLNTEIPTIVGLEDIDFEKNCALQD